jgi:general secretion pathway protein M
MKAWLASLDPRERNALIFGGILLAMVLIYVLVWQPFNARATRLEQTVQEQRALKQWMQNAALEVQRLRATQVPASMRAGMGGQSLLAVVDQAARKDRLGTVLKRIEPEGTSIVRVWFEQAIFDDVLLWLGDLQNTYGVRITSISIDHQNGSAGSVNARVELEGGG